MQNSWMSLAVVSKQSDQPKSTQSDGRIKRVYNKKNPECLSNHPRSFNTKEHQIVALFKNGVDIGEIPGKAGASRTYVREILVRHGLVETKRKPPSKRPVIQMSLSGELIAEFESVRAAQRALGITATQIWRCCVGKVKTASGFVFKYK